MFQFTVFAIGPAGGKNRALGLAPLETFADHHLAHEWLSKETDQFTKQLYWKGAVYVRAIIVPDYILGGSNENNPFKPSGYG